MKLSTYLSSKDSKRLEKYSKLLGKTPYKLSQEFITYGLDQLDSNIEISMGKRFLEALKKDSMITREGIKKDLLFET